MKTLDFKQLILDALSLKSKKVTILLGTFFPFFVCHVGAYACLIGDLQSKKSIFLKIVDWLFGYFFLFLLLFIGELTIYLLFFTESNLTSTIFWIVGFLVFISGNFSLTSICYEIFQERKSS